MKKLLITLFLISISIVSISQIRYTPFYTKIEFRDTAKFIKPIKIGLVPLISTATELNLLHNSGLTSSDISNIRNSSSNLQTQINTKAPIANPQFTGIPRVSTDTLSTKAYIREYVNNHSPIIPPIDIDIDLNTVTNEVERKLDSVVTASVQLHSRSPYWSDTATYIATKDYTENLINDIEFTGSNNKYELLGIVGITSDFPVDGDSILVNSYFANLDNVDVYRNGILQHFLPEFSNNIASLSDTYVFDNSSGAIIVKPDFTLNEKVRIKGDVNANTTFILPTGVPTPPVSNVIAGWKLDETSGTTVIDVLSTNNGTTTATINQNGKFGRAHSFNGSQTSTFGTNVGDLGTSDFGYSCWIYVPVLQSAYNGFLEMSSNVVSFYAMVDGDNYIRTVITFDDVNYIHITSNSSIAPGTWINIILNYDRDGVGTLYVNGVAQIDTEDISTYSTVNIQNTLGFKLGVGGTSSWFYNGLMDDVYIYNSTLSQSQINAIQIGSYPW